MQTTDKVTRPFLLKLLLLFALLLSGAMIKAPGLKGTTGNKTSKNSLPSPQVQEEKTNADDYYSTPVNQNLTSVSM